MKTRTEIRLGEELKKLRLVANNGKRMSEGAFGKERFDWSGSIQRRIEQGKVKDDELAKILEAYPQLGQLAFESAEPLERPQAAAEEPQASPPGETPSQPTTTPEDDVLDLPSDRHVFAPELHAAPTGDYGDLIALSEEELDDPDTLAAVESSPALTEAIETYAQELQDRHVMDPRTIEEKIQDDATAAELVGVEPVIPDPTTPPTTKAAGEQSGEQTSEGPVQEDGTILVSNSEIQSFKRCRRKWWLGWYRGLRPAVEDVTGARAIGIRVHRALKAWYVPEGETPVDPRDALERSIAQDWTEMVTKHREFFGEDPPESVAKQFQEDTSLERAMVEGYLEWLQETGADRDIRVISSETYVETELPELRNRRPVKLIAKLDAQAHRATDGAVLFLDHKTVGSINAPVKTLHMDEQFLYYSLIQWLRGVNQDGRVIGALYNMLRKVKRTARATPPFYSRAEVQHTSIELNNFRKQITGVIAQMSEARAHLNSGTDHHVIVPPSRRNTCSWDCDFFSVCPLFDDGSRVDDMLASNFVAGNPLDHYRDRDRDYDQEE